jgi:hypothetical protein
MCQHTLLHARPCRRTSQIIGLQWGAYQLHEPEAIPRIWAAIMQKLRAGKVSATRVRELSQ